METVQIVLDKKLLRAADRAARQQRRNRSAFIRDALREHLRALAIREKEQRDRIGYTGSKAGPDESAVWETEASWPEE
jgi:metal-responsive CopG/Arc/MetJ family transcriptional regulator